MTSNVAAKIHSTERFLSAADLRARPNDIFVFGDNTLRVGKGGAAALRDEPNAYGFITKRVPTNADDSFYRCEDYQEVFEEELKKLTDQILSNPDKTFMISKLGAGLANRYQIFEGIIEPGLKTLLQYPNVEFLFPIQQKRKRLSL